MLDVLGGIALTALVVFLIPFCLVSGLAIAVWLFGRLID